MVQYRVAVAPDDEFNRRLVDSVHPAEWTNPHGTGTYNLVVIGAGTAGLVTAAGAAGLGARVALIERHLMGGDCLNTGCVPSKALIRSSRVAAQARRSAEYGVHTGAVRVDFADVMARMRRLRADIAPNDSAARFRDLGVDVYLGHARFVSAREIVVDRASWLPDRTDDGRSDAARRPRGDSDNSGPRLRFARAVIATGARPREVQIPGLAGAGYLTSDTIFELTELPERLVVIGGGPIGCELAQAFARFGARVTVVETGPRLLGKEEPDASAIAAQALERDGVTVLVDARVVRVEPDRTVVVDSARGVTRVAATAVLVAAGRTPNLHHLDVERAGVTWDERGVAVDERMRTSNRHIYAAGDVASPERFTHAADAMARLIIRNALFFGRNKVAGLIIPRVTFTDPEIASVGLTGEQAAARRLAIDTFEVSLDHIDRAVLDGRTDGFVRVHVREGRDDIVGATVVAPHAGEMIGEFTVAMTHKLGLARLGSTIHPYPTTALAVRQVADRYQRTRLTPWLARLFGKFLAWRRG